MNYERIHDIRTNNELKRMKHKLHLYFDYVKEYNLIQAQLFEYEEALAYNQNNPTQSANECGIKSLDPQHPAVQQLILTIASCEKDLELIDIERGYIGIDGFIDELNTEDYNLLKYVYCDGLTFEEAGVRIDYTKSGVRSKIQSIVKKYVKKLK